MNEKAIEAAAKALWMCNDCTGDCFDDNGNECPHCFGSGMDIRAAIAAYEAALWRPIEEAPGASDGVDVIVFGGRFEEPTALPSDGAWWALQKSERSTTIPTHFRPLPAAPENHQ